MKEKKKRGEKKEKYKRIALQVKVYNTYTCKTFYSRPETLSLSQLFGSLLLLSIVDVINKTAFFSAFARSLKRERGINRTKAEEGRYQEIDKYRRLVDM